MNELARSLPSVLVSLAVHAVMIVVLLLIPVIVPSFIPEIMLESIFSDPFPQEQITREVDLQTTPAETLNIVAGGSLSATVGVSSQPIATPLNIQESSVMKEVDPRPVLTDLALPADTMITTDLGEGEITGDVGSIVEGYGAAMGIITQELIRMMRQQKVTVVWLFDESGSLVDDRREIRDNYLRVYRELEIATSQDGDLRRGNELLLTVVAGYGQGLHEVTPRPTADTEQIRKAFDLLPVDESGVENMCHAITEIVNRHRQSAGRGRRKLAIIVVTDESGDDGEYVEQAISAARSAKAPVYFLSRESVFGYPFAHQRWTHEESGETFWLQIRRGPETEYPECLQWNGLHARFDVQSAGFGPYEQVRIAKETGGIFFLLPGEEENLVGHEANDKRRYEFLAMREYQPLLLSRPEYVLQRSLSPFRETLFRVIERLNPSENTLLFTRHDPELNLRRELYPIENQAFRAEAASQVVRAGKAMLLIDEALRLLNDVEPLRAQETSPRWRAGYDLAVAQLHVFRLRLYQYLLAMDRHANHMPQLTNPQSNRWDFWWTREKIVPDEAQFSRLKKAFQLSMNREEYLAMVEAEEKSAVDRLQSVIRRHPGTPWARRAEREISDGFGFHVVERLWNPQGVREVIQRQLPKL